MEGNGHVTLFQTQVKSMLDTLLNVAVTEITQIFQSIGESVANAIRNSEDVSGAFRELHTMLECRLKNTLERVAPHDYTNTSYTNKLLFPNTELYLERQPANKPNGIQTNLDLALKRERENVDWQVNYLGELMESKQDDLPRVTSQQQECSEGLQRASSTQVECWKVEGLEMDPVAASTPRNRPERVASSVNQEALNTRRTPEHGVSDSVFKDEASSPSDVKMVPEVEPAELPELQKDSERHPPVSSPTGDTSPADAVSPSLALTPPPRPPGLPRLQVPPLRSCSVRLVDLGRVGRPLAPRHFVCSGCGGLFPRERDLRRHRRVHTVEKPHACALCHRSYALKKNLKKHTGDHAGGKSYLCEYCGKLFRFKGSLRVHSRFHTGDKPHACAVCGKQYRVRKDLREHIQMHSETIPVSVKPR